MSGKEIEFQSIEWSIYNKDDDDDNDDISDDESENQNIKSNGNYKVKIYGRKENGKSVTVEVNNFRPYFFVKIPDKWKLQNVILLVNHFKTKINKSAVNGLEDFKIIEKKDSYGFNADKIFKFLKLTFKDTVSYKAFENYIEYNKINNRSLFNNPVKLKLYESNLEPLLKFFHVKDLQPCNWIKIKNARKVPKSSYCDEDYVVDHSDVSFFENNKSAKLVVISFDIECKPEDGASFPQADKDKDVVTQIGSTFSYHGDPEPFHKSIITLGKAKKVDGLEGTTIESYDNEIKVLLAWTKLVQKMDPDIVTGFNINGFDFDYLHKRSKKLGISVQFSKLGRDLNACCK